LKNAIFNDGKSGLLGQPAVPFSGGGGQFALDPQFKLGGTKICKIRRENLRTFIGPKKLVLPMFRQEFFPEFFLNLNLTGLCSENFFDPFFNIQGKKFLGKNKGPEIKNCPRPPNFSDRPYQPGLYEQAPEHRFCVCDIS
jgi:hypothetical protein